MTSSSGRMLFFDKLCDMLYVRIEVVHGPLKDIENLLGRYLPIKMNEPVSVLRHFHQRFPKVKWNDPFFAEDDEYILIVLGTTQSLSGDDMVSDIQACLNSDLKLPRGAMVVAAVSDEIVFCKCAQFLQIFQVFSDPAKTVDYETFVYHRRSFPQTIEMNSRSYISR